LPRALAHGRNALSNRFHPWQLSSDSVIDATWPAAIGLPSLINCLLEKSSWKLLTGAWSRWNYANYDDNSGSAKKKQHYAGNRYNPATTGFQSSCHVDSTLKGLYYYKHFASPGKITLQ